MTDENRNQGEGDRESARRYNENLRDSVAEGDSAEAAEKARRDLEGAEGESLKRAEEEGKSHAKDFDPAVTEGGSKSS